MTDPGDYTVEALLERLDNMSVDRLRFALKAALIAEKIDSFTFLKMLDLAEVIK